MSLVHCAMHMDLWLGGLWFVTWTLLGFIECVAGSIIEDW